MAIALALTSAMAGPDPVPITAEQAFDAVTTGIDPITGVDYGIGKVVIVDVRTPPEYQFQGTAGKVDSILLKDATRPVVPDQGKVMFTRQGRLLEYKLGGQKQETAIEQVAKLETSSIAVSIPCATWNQVTTEMDPVPDTFAKGIEGLARDGVQVVISMCNSGGRSTACVAKFVSDELASHFKAFYEIDQAADLYFNPDRKLHLAGLGGFQGSAYRGVYNGFSGFPGRLTTEQPVQGWKQGKPNGPSVSWKDSGLPIFIPETSCNLPDMPRTP
jgi:rhodanese-related sulfurtransferase